MTSRLATRACEIQKQKMLEQLARELARKDELEVVDLRHLFPSKDDADRVRESF